MSSMNIIDRKDDGTKVSKKKNKEKNLTVKPIRIQIEKRNKGLKDTLKVGFQSSEVSPLETQIAGHGSCDDGLDGMLQHHLGFVLKPVQPPPRGDREVDFYRKISSSNHEDDVSFRPKTPRFHGVENIVKEDGSKSQYLVLENLNFGFSKPCVMDIKIGKITYGHDASSSKIERESKSYPGTKIPFGFSVLGIISHSPNGYNRLTKAFGRSLDQTSLDQILEHFLQCNEKYSKNLAKGFLMKLKEIEELFMKQKSYHVFASSILFAYDFASLETVDWETDNPVRVNMIDFAHIFPGDGTLDENYLFGLRSLIRIFENFIQK